MKKLLTSESFLRRLAICSIIVTTVVCIGGYSYVDNIRVKRETVEKAADAAAERHRAMNDLDLYYYAN